jgi:DNA-binding CsgD family transcriptional regulator
MQDYDQLIRLAYGSLACAEARRTFIAALAAATRSQFVALQVDDQSTHRHRVPSHFDSDGNPCPELDSRAELIEVDNPWFVAEAADRLLKNGAACDRGLIEPGALRKTDFHELILKPMDIFHSMGMLLSVTPGQISLLTVSRSSRVGHFDEEELLLARNLVPHLRNLKQIQSSFRLDQKARYAQPDLSWLLDKSGRVIGDFGNCEPVAAVVKEVRGFLQPIFSQDRERFALALRKVGSGSSLQERLLLLDRNGFPAVALRLQFSPPPLFQSWLLTDAPAILVFAKQVLRSLNEIEAAVRCLYGLTSAEARVVKMLYETNSVREISARTGRSVETIRSQLKAIFQKTGTKGQLQLLRLIETLVQV